MPLLSFDIESAEVMHSAAAPTISFKLRVSSAKNEPIRAIALQTQIHIESARRPYQADEKQRLHELFGEPHRWHQTLRSMFWIQVNTNVSSFNDETVVDLPVPCTFDFNVATTKYLGSLAEGDVPLSFLFSGTVFYTAPNGQLQVDPIPWNNESRYKLPISVWKEMMATYYPNERWVSIRNDVFDRLTEYKSRRAIPTLDQALEDLLSTANHVDDRPLMSGEIS